MKETLSVKPNIEQMSQMNQVSHTGQEGSLGVQSVRVRAAVATGAILPRQHGGVAEAAVRVPRLSTDS